MLEKWFYKTMLFLLVRSAFLYKKNDDGLGVVDTQPKHILDGNEYNHLIDDADLSVMEMGNNITIENEVMAVKKIILQYHYQTKRLAEYFYRKKSEDILQLVFDFANNHIRYKNDDIRIKYDFFISIKIFKKSTGNIFDLGYLIEIMDTIKKHLYIREQ